jgi:hypothetical protein
LIALCAAVTASIIIAQVRGWGKVRCHNAAVENCWLRLHLRPEILLDGLFVEGGRVEEARDYSELVERLVSIKRGVMTEPLGGFFPASLSFLECRKRVAFLDSSDYARHLPRYIGNRHLSSNSRWPK